MLIGTVIIICLAILIFMVLRPSRAEKQEVSYSIRNGKYEYGGSESQLVGIVQGDELVEELKKIPGHGNHEYWQYESLSYSAES